MLKELYPILRNITLRRIFNILLIEMSYYLSLLFRKPFHCGWPYSVSIEPTTSCNLQCPECPSGLRSFTRPSGHICLDQYKKFIDQLYPNLFYLMLYFQGEPYLNPAFFDMVKYARKKKVYTATSTNAHFLNDRIARKTVESGLDKLIVSMDGTDQETYEKYRIGGKLNKVTEGIKNIQRWKRDLKSRTPFLTVQFIVFRTNEHQIPEIKKLCKELGVDKLELKSAQIYTFEDKKDLIPKNLEYARYEQTVDAEGEVKYIIKSDLPNKCYRMWHSCVITWDGRVVPCCFDKDAAHIMGDLSNTSFKDIWRSDIYREFRASVLINRKGIDICSNCTEGLKT